MRITYTVSTKLSLEEIKERIREMNITLGNPEKPYETSYPDNEKIKYHMWIANSSMSLNIDIYELPIRKERTILFSLDAMDDVFENISEKIKKELAKYFGKKSIFTTSGPVKSQINVEAYKLLNELETRLRKTVENRLRKTYGNDWIKKIPENMKREWEKRMKNEKESKWVSPSSSLIDYSDFKDMRTLIGDNTNWSLCFKEIFGSKKEVIIGKMAELEFLRNKIAHNRLLSIEEFNSFKLHCDKILKFIENI